MVLINNNLILNLVFMEAKKILLYIVLAAVGFLGIVGIIQLTKVSTEIKASRRNIDSVMQVVKESKMIIQKQAGTIDKMQELNLDLYRKVNESDSINKLIKQSIDIKLNNANKTLKDIKKEIEEIEIPIIN